MLLYMHVYVCLSSPFLFVCSDDLVTCHTRAHDNPGGDDEAERQSEG